MIPAIRLAVLDMAGTTVSDDGVVLRAFGRALEAVEVEDFDPGGHLVGLAEAGAISSIHI